MSRQITQPLNQVRLTNVAVVRLSRGGHRFEVACYRNKIVNYRQGTETDLSEVLQTERVFANVSKGQFANSKTLKKCFGTADEAEVCRLILDRGDVQVSDQERAARLESTSREVASAVAGKCVDPASRRPYTMAQIRDAMKAAGFMVHPTRNVKQQFLECVKLLQRTGVLDIERAKMELALVLVDEDEDGNFAGRRNNAIDLLTEEGVARSDILPPKDDRDARIVFQSDPSLYRKMDGIARDPSVQGRIEIIQQCVTEEGDVTLGSELERRAQHQQQQQQRHQRESEENARNKLIADDDEQEDLARKLQSNLALKENSVPFEENAAQKPANSRKAQKAAQKKSKKAKRREKEERAERERQVAAERERQRERAERLGIDKGVAAPPADNIQTDRAGGEGGGGGGTKSCNTCGGAFAPGQYRLHFRSDWHRYNVKLKMRGCVPVSEKEFLLCDADAFFE